MSLSTEVQQPSTDPYIELFDLDATGIGGGTYHFCQSSLESSAIVWRGTTYTPFDVLGKGFGMDSQGALPRPTLTVTNVTKALMGAVIAWNDLLGAVVTRWRTFRKFLDGQSAADPDAHFVEDVYIIERKISANKYAIEWELSPFGFSEGAKIPRRQIIKDLCSWTYRRWNGSAFDYTGVKCPYTGGSYWNSKNESCAASEDRCGRWLSSCELRFGGGEIPTAAFPGVSKIRVR